MKMEAEKKIEAFYLSPNRIFKFRKMMKKVGKDVEGGKFIQDVGRRIVVNEIDRKRIWKQDMEKILKKMIGTE